MSICVLLALSLLVGALNANTNVYELFSQQIQLQVTIASQILNETKEILEESKNNSKEDFINTLNKTFTEAYEVAVNPILNTADKDCIAEAKYLTDSYILDSVEKIIKCQEATQAYEKIQTVEGTTDLEQNLNLMSYNILNNAKNCHQKDVIAQLDCMQRKAENSNPTLEELTKQITRNLHKIGGLRLLIQIEYTQCIIQENKTLPHMLLDIKSAVNACIPVQSTVTSKISSKAPLTPPVTFETSSKEPLTPASKTTEQVTTPAPKTSTKQVTTSTPKTTTEQDTTTTTEQKTTPAPKTTTEQETTTPKTTPEQVTTSSSKTTEQVTTPAPKTTTEQETTTPKTSPEQVITSAAKTSTEQVTTPATKTTTEQETTTPKTPPEQVTTSSSKATEQVTTTATKTTTEQETTTPKTSPEQETTTPKTPPEQVTTPSSKTTEQETTTTPKTFPEQVTTPAPEDK